ncbi:FAD:protein FMN transferase [Sphingomonas rubra]|uniref:FAD:protein FMN transferase n=1 Tax=Sphingomonas rubra TaxID=634430 RepID=A0A1I5THA4_9SPHN|nr:FAD:protein FMN transferase [Sphingomonas rubra]SFP82440.1 thiamine biosynthesis lipoprotein [Sphingomonas rubra]
MGTTWRVLYAGRWPAAETRAGIVGRLAGLVTQLSHWDATSAVGRFNDAPAGSRMRLPPDLARVVDEGWRIAEASGGAFDPAIGALVDAWGFGPPGRRPPPTATDIARARANSGYRRLAWRPVERLLHQPGGVRLDLSGIAKGYAVDAIADLLAGRGIRHCLVEIGGELAGRGLRPDGDPWWIELENPPGIALPPVRVALHGLAVATSGTYRRGDHTIDPRTGHAPPGGVVAASAIAPTAMRADALASAALVAYPHLAGAGLAEVPLRLIVAGEAGPVEIITPPLAAMID